MKLPGTLVARAIVLVAISLLATAVAGCGSDAGQSAAQSTQVAPSPTFQTIKVTVPPEASSSPTNITAADANSHRLLPQTATAARCPLSSLNARCVDVNGI